MRTGAEMEAFQVASHLPLSCMGSRMPDKVHSVIEAFPTLSTFMWLFNVVDALVPTQIGSQAEGLPTVEAAVRFFHCMVFLVRSEM